MKYLTIPDHYYAKKPGVHTMDKEAFYDWFWHQHVLNPYCWNRSPNDKWKDLTPHFCLAGIAENEKNDKGHYSRLIANHDTQYGIVLDYDKGKTFQQIEKILTGYRYILYSSIYHGIKNQGRCRVILLLKEPCSSHHWKNSLLKSCIIKYFHCDDASSTGTMRFFLMPAIFNSSCKYYYSKNDFGEWFSLQNEDFIELIRREREREDNLHKQEIRLPSAPSKKGKSPALNWVRTKLSHIDINVRGKGNDITRHIQSCVMKLRDADFPNTEIQSFLLGFASHKETIRQIKSLTR